jgi:hypothetical protein
MIKICQLQKDLNAILIIWFLANVFIFLLNVNSLICMINALSSLITFFVCQMILKEMIE